MTFPITSVERYVDETGRLTAEGQLVLQDLARRIEELEAALNALANIPAPTGGAMIDAEARAAIADIIAAAS